MKKHDEGYVLAYVTVVLLIFCLVATTILTGAFRNLQAQQNANQQMKDRYVAAGEIEKVLAQWNTYDWSDLDEEPLEGIPVDGTNVKYLGRNDTEVTLYAESGTVAITCKIKLDGKTYAEYEVSIIEPPSDEIGGEG